MLAQLRSGELTVETVSYQLGGGVGSSCEGDALILFRLLGFAINSFDRPPQIGAVGPVVYALNDFSPVFYCDPMSLWRSHHSLSTTGARWDPACVSRLAPPSWLRSPTGTCFVHSLRLPMGI